MFESRWTLTSSNHCVSWTGAPVFLPLRARAAFTCILRISRSVSEAVSEAGTQEFSVFSEMYVDVVPSDCIGGISRKAVSLSIDVWHHGLSLWRNGAKRHKDHKQCAVLATSGLNILYRFYCCQHWIAPAGLRIQPALTAQHQDVLPFRYSALLSLCSLT